MKKAILFAAGGLISAVVLLFLLYGGYISDYLGYITEQVFFAHGDSPIFSRPYSPLAIFLSYGTGIGLYSSSPFLFLAGYAAIMFSLIYIHNGFTSFRNNSTLQFSLIWLFLTFLLLFSSNYRPLRYSFLIYLPLILVIVSAIDLKEIKESALSRGRSVAVMIICLLVNYFFLAHVITDFIYPDAYPTRLWPVYKYLFFPSVMLTIFMFVKPVQKTLFRLIPRLWIFILAVTCCSLLFNLYIYHRAHESRANSLDFMADTVHEILGDDAVLTGPHAPRLTLGNDREHFIYCFGLKKPDTSIFDMFPITHLAVDHANRDLAIKDYPLLSDATEIADFLMLNHVVNILRIKDLPPDYRLSDYELAQNFLQQQELDSAYFYNKRCLQKNPDNLLAQRQLFRIKMRSADVTGMLKVLDKIFAELPDELNAQYFCALLYKKIGLRYGRSKMIDKSRIALERAKKLGRSIEKNIQRYYDKTR